MCSYSARLAAVVLACGCCAWLLAVGGPPAAAEPAEAVAVQFSKYAPADDLAKQVAMFVERLDESVADAGTYDDVNQTRTLRDASTLGVLALALAMHDQEHALRANAPGLLAASKDLAASHEDFAKAKAAFEEVKAAIKEPVAAGDGANLHWHGVGDVSVHMKQVPFVHNRLRRGLTDARRFERAAEENAGYAATLAAVAQVSRYLPPDAAKAQQWQQFCDEMRDASGALNAAVHGKDFDAASAAARRLNQSCNNCHAVFRTEP